MSHAGREATCQGCLFRFPLLGWLSRLAGAIPIAPQLLREQVGRLLAGAATAATMRAQN